MSKQTDYLRWVMQCGKERRYAGEDYFWAVLESAIADVDERMMELPLDVDEVPIRVGDAVRNKLTGDEYKVEAVGVGCFFAWRDAVCRYVQLEAEGYVHHKPRTLEDVLRDFLSDMADAGDGDPKLMNEAEERAIAKAVEEIREGMMSRDEMTLVLRRMVDTLPDVETDICTEIGRAVDEIAGRMW